MIFCISGSVCVTFMVPYRAAKVKREKFNVSLSVQLNLQGLILAVICGIIEARSRGDPGSYQKKEEWIMLAGVSTACLYPQHLEEAVYELALNGITCAELFINADSDIDRRHLHTINSFRERFGMTFPSVHPFACPLESMTLFGGYDRRVEDMIDYYKKTFEAMNRLGSQFFVLHGCEKRFAVDAGLYCERYMRLYEAGQEFGITVAQENVERCQSGSLAFLREMSRMLGSDAKFVLDVKQAVRAGEDPMEMVSTLGTHIVHVHISDHSDKGDCLLLGQGQFRIRAFLEMLSRCSPDAAVILELYRSGYRGISDLVSSYRMLRSMIRSVENAGTGGEFTAKRK